MDEYLVFFDQSERAKSDIHVLCFILIFDAYMPVYCSFLHLYMYTFHQIIESAFLKRSKKSFLLFCNDIKLLI